jgi:hypothetical protein
MRAHEAFTNNAITATPATVTLNGGKYWFSVVGVFGGATVALERVAADGEFLLVGSSASLTAAGGCVVDLPPGQYAPVITGAGGTTLVYTEIIRIPEE